MWPGPAPPCTEAPSPGPGSFFRLPIGLKVEPRGQTGGGSQMPAELPPEGAEVPACGQTT